MKPTIAVTLPQPLAAALRAEAAKQRRPLSWVVEDLLSKALKVNAKKPARQTV